MGAGNIFESMVEELLQNSIQNEGAGFDVGFSGRTRLQIPERPQFTHDSTEGRSWQLLGDVHQKVERSASIHPC